MIGAGLKRSGKECVQSLMGIGSVSDEGGSKV